jgi:hypothetical protein
MQPTSKSKKVERKRVVDRVATKWAFVISRNAKLDKTKFSILQNFFSLNFRGLPSPPVGHSIIHPPCPGLTYTPWGLRPEQWGGRCYGGKHHDEGAATIM